MDTRKNPDREDRERNRVDPDAVGTAGSASVDGRTPAGTDPDATLSTAGGAAGGAAAGLAAGMVTLGPIGGIIGAIAGVVGGAWAGLASGMAADGSYSDAHDAEYRTHYERDELRLADRSYDDIRPAYQLGHLAAGNPDYAGREWDAIEGDLRHGWTPEVAARHGPWESASRYARSAYELRRAQPIGRGFVDTKMGGTESHQRASFSDPIPDGDPDNVLGEHGRIPGRET